MQVLFVGAQGTGKPSVMEALPSTWPKIKGITRKCIADKKLDINESATDRTQRAIFDTYEHALDVREDFISERSLFDVYAFTSYQYLYKKCSESLLKEQSHRLAQYIRKHPNALYVYFPIEFPPVSDGQRSTDAEYQKAIDQLMFANLVMSGVNFMSVSGTVEERVNQIIEKVSFKG
jgi:hypothetical protein